MKEPKLNPRPEIAIPVMALLLASLISVSLVGLRIFWTGHWQNLYLVWNLFLAWLPLGFSLLVYRAYQNGSRQGWRFFCYAFAWLLFFPNAPYIFTDLIHLMSHHSGHFWVDLVLILLFAWTGFLLGFLSLYLMQSLVARELGGAASWLFIAVVAGLSGCGIYVGRFLRWNSWDVLLNPVGLFRDLAHWAANPLVHSNASLFPVLFAVFLFMAYVMLYALTHLRSMASVITPHPPVEHQSDDHERANSEFPKWLVSSPVLKTKST